MQRLWGCRKMIISQLIPHLHHFWFRALSNKGREVADTKKKRKDKGSLSLHILPPQTLQESIGTRAWERGTLFLLPLAHTASHSAIIISTVFNTFDNLILLFHSGFEKIRAAIYVFQFQGSQFLVLEEYYYFIQEKQIPSGWKLAANSPFHPLLWEKHKVSGFLQRCQWRLFSDAWKQPTLWLRFPLCARASFWRQKQLWVFSHPDIRKEVSGTGWAADCGKASCRKALQVKKKIQTVEEQRG